MDSRRTHVTGTPPRNPSRRPPRILLRRERFPERESPEESTFPDFRSTMIREIPRNFLKNPLFHPLKSSDPRLQRTKPTHGTPESPSPPGRASSRRQAKPRKRPSRPTASPEDSGRTGPAASGRSAPPPERSTRPDKKDAGWKIIGFSNLHSIVGGSTSGTEVPAPRRFEPIADRTACGRSIP